MSNIGRKRLRLEASSPHYSPPSPHYSPPSPHYSPPSPHYSPPSPHYSPSSHTAAASPVYSPGSPSYNFPFCPPTPLYHTSHLSHPLSPCVTTLSPHHSPVQDSDRGGHEEMGPSTVQVNTFEIAEQLFRAVPLSEIEQLKQLELDDLLQTSIASTFRAAIGLSFARDDTNLLAAEKKRLQAEKEGLAARVVELERKLSIERGFMALRFTELQGKNAQLHVLESMLEEEKQRNANLQRRLESLSGQVKATLDAFQTSHEFNAIKDEEYSRGFADCRARVENSFPGLDLSFLNQNDPDTAATRE